MKSIRRPWLVPVWQLLSLYQFQERISKQKPIIAIVETMLQFIQVGIQMLRREFVIRPYNGAFKQAPHALYAVSVNVSAYPLVLRVLNRFMARVGIVYTLVVNVFVRVDRFTRGVGRFCYKLSKLKTIAVGNDFQADFSTALNCADHRSFILSFKAHALSADATANIRLINFNDALQLFSGNFAHSSADTMTEKPRGFVGSFKCALNLAGRNAFFGFDHQIDSEKPFPKRQVRIVKNRIARYGKLITTHVAIILVALRD